jgi:ribosomal protein S18 acetylase RimI-like enzyme
MLRTFRTADLPAYYDLMVGQFPQENAILGWRREAFFRIVKRLDSWSIRLLLGVMSLLGRPIYRFWIIEQDSQIAGSALETFGAKSAYVSSVVVDPRFRRRGFAKKLLEACHTSARKRGLRYVVLDVIDGNDTALALYRSLGYAPVGHGSLYQRTEGGEPSAPSTSSRVRPFVKSDRKAVAAIASVTVSEARQRIHPVNPDDYLDAPAVVRALDSTSEAWVVDSGMGATAWVRASCSPATEAAHLNAPVVASHADPADVDAMLATALGWTRSQGAARVVVEAWDENVPGVAALRAAGFTPAYGVQTLAYPTGRG